ncbi:carbohydrate binding domain-containing protein [Streptomyces sp. NPDC004610]|uniref:carbohydrate binding domain-containing protein n=1 Tax=unclassified Streptomyces TaxID=2593676 RepID=UPI0033B1AE8F
MPFDILTEIELPGGQWIPVRTYERDTIEVTTGRPDMGTQTDPGSLTVTIDNRAARYSWRNPESDLYGLIGPNTRIRTSVPGQVTYLQLDGSPANLASTPDHTSLDITGDLDVRWEGEADWHGAGARMLVGKWADAGQRSYHLRIQDGFVVLQCTTDGTFGEWHSGELPALPRRAALRGVLDTGTPAGGFTFTFYWAPSLDGPWTRIGEGVYPTGAFSTFVSTAPLTVAPSQLDALAVPQRPPMAGRCYRAEVRNGINGTVVASPDFSAQAPGTTGFTDSAGRAWTVAGNATIRDREDLIVAEVPEWPQGWTPDESDGWVTIEAAGILRRLSQGRKQLQSTLRRRIPSGLPLAYWPMEDGRDATSASSPLPMVRPLFMRGWDMAADDGLAGSAALPVIRSQATLSGTIWRGPTTGQWHTEFIYFLPNTGPATARTVLQWTSSGTVKRWRLMLKTLEASVLGYDSEEQLVINQPVTLGTNLFNAWVRWQLMAAQDGSTVDWRVRWIPIGGTGGAVTGSYTGTAGRITGVRGTDGGASGDLDGLVIGHIGVFAEENTFIYNFADHGFNGDSAWARMRRLSSEEGLPIGRVRGPVPSLPIGPQRQDTVLNLVQAAADSDGGRLLEDRARPALLYRDRTSMYSQTPTLTLSYSDAPGLAHPLDPVDDDTAYRNDRTVTRDGGSNARAVLETGRLSIQAPPDGIGLYDDSVTLSLHTDDQAETVAFWRLHQGTVDAPRYPQVKVLLHKAPQLIPAVLATPEGNLIRITGLPKRVGGGTADLLVEGIKHELTLETWTVTFNCSPGQPWNVAKVSDPRLGRADASAAGSTVAVPVSATGTQFAVHTPARDHRAPVPWITSLDRLTTNPDMEADLAGWTPTGATTARVPTPAAAPFGGDWSMQLTPTGAAATAYAESTPVTTGITAGSTYTVHAWVRCAVARTVNVNVNWYTSGGTYISTTGVSQAVTAGVWTRISGTLTAPATAARASLAPTMTGTPPSSHVLLVDVAFLGTGTRGQYARDFPFDLRTGGEVIRIRGCEPAARDTFTRSAGSTWGTADNGLGWAQNGGANSDRSVNGTSGVITLASAPDTVRFQRILAGIADAEVLVRLSVDQIATGSSFVPGVLLRYTDASNYYRARLHFGTGGAMFTSITRTTTAVGGTLSLPYTYTAGQWFRLRARITGHRIQLRAWPDGTREPRAWHSDETVTTSPIATGQIGLTGSAFTANTNVNPQLRFDDFQVPTPQLMTVQRSVNGITKPHPAGGEVRLAQPAIVAL